MNEKKGCLDFLFFVFSTNKPEIFWPVKFTVGLHDLPEFFRLVAIGSIALTDVEECDATKVQ